MYIIWMDCRIMVLLECNFTSSQQLGGISYHDIRGVCEDDRKKLAKDLGPQNKVTLW